MIAVLALILPIAFIALALLLIWTVVVSITLYLRPTSEPSAGRPRLRPDPLPESAS